MAEKVCSSLNTSAASNMDIEQQKAKDVSKVFALLRAKLNGKEKELLELQRAQPCLLAPDSQQIETLLDIISSLQLSTQEGSFIFPSDGSSSSSSSSSTSVCSTGIDLIKTLPSKVWLRESVPVKQTEDQKNQYRLPMITQLLSLPVSAYIASSSANRTLPSFETDVKTKDEPSNRLPMVSQLLSMPINAFKSSSGIESTKDSTPVQIEEKKDCTPIQIEEKKEVEMINDKVIPTRELPKSILESESIYSKEHWLRKSSSSSESDFVTLDLDEYIEKSSEKMRRLHMEYLSALDKLKTPSNPIDSAQMLKSMYPQMYDRIQQDMSKTDLIRLLPSQK